MSDPRQVERAIDAIRRGWPIAIRGSGDDLTLLAVETTDPVTLDTFAPARHDAILISHQRAVTLKLTNQLPAASPSSPVQVDAARSFSVEEATALVDPQLDLRYPMKGPFRTTPLADDLAARAAITLARLAGLLPGFFVDVIDPELIVEADAIERYHRLSSVKIATSARLPLVWAEGARVVAFRGLNQATEHVALLVGERGAGPPLVRLHSECLTGDVFGSLKCDCGPQLDTALARMSADGDGVLLYLRQEGRGIGLLNKLRAYQLQDQGFDTVDANIRLGFAVDERDYGVAAAMLRALGVEHVRLLTNNLAKVAALEAHGVTVAQRVPLVLPPTPFNRGYLDTKRDRTGHQL